MDVPVFVSRCVEMLKQLMKVPKTVLQDGVPLWYEKTGGGWNQKVEMETPETKVLLNGVEGVSGRAEC